MDFKNKVKGCLAGGAAGDALGYPIEFSSYAEIVRKYGKEGISELVLYNTDSGHRALVSDDTQMTLFCASAIIDALRAEVSPSINTYIKYSYESFLNWLETQGHGYKLPRNVTRSPLMRYKALFAARAPGNSCLSALMSGKLGTASSPINNSKGCGAVMRAAPIGFLPFLQKDFTRSNTAVLSAEIGAITHGHELGYLPAAMLSIMISDILAGKAPHEAVMSAEKFLVEIFADTHHMQTLSALIRKAMTLAESRDHDDLESIKMLGEGWVGEEALAIAIYCSVKYENDFEHALTASVNHSGDSDSTGAIVGNILGTYIGYEAIPEKFKIKTDVSEIIDIITEDFAKLADRK